MKNIGRTFLIGFSILLPVIISIQLVVWLISTLESWLRPLWLLLLPEAWYLPGFAIVSFFLVATLIGMSAHLPGISHVWKMPGRLLEKMPLVSTIYGIINDLLELLSGKSFTDQAVVWVSFPGQDIKVLGIVTKTGTDKSSKLSKIIKDDEVAVYLPMSYQSGGYLVIVQQDRLERVDMEPGDALRLIMSAGLGKRTGPA